MNSAERVQLQPVLHSRRDSIAGCWHKAIARTCFVPLSATEVRQRLVELTEQAIALLLAEPFEERQAEAIGASLASMHYIQPEALGRTQEVLGQHLVAGLPANQVTALQPRLAALLGRLAAGFFQQARETILVEQEQTRSAVLTTLRRTEEALRGSEEKLRAQYKGIPIPTYTWQRVGDDFELIDYNDAADRTVHGRMAEFIGDSASELYRDRPEIRADLARCYTERIPIQREMRYRYKATGETRHLAVNYGFVPPDLVLVHTEDITERKQVEAQLIQADKMASMGVLAGAITHQLKNPLTIMSANAQVLRDHLCDNPVHIRCAKNIHDTTQRLSTIIDNLVQFSRPKNDTMMETDLRFVLEETLPLVTHLMSSQQVTLQQKLEPDLPHIFGNPALLQQVFTNLILNACNAMPDGGTLTIAASTNRTGEAQIAFTDTGHGIRPRDLPNIFDPFFTTMPWGEGTGLGLSVSYSIVQLHGGHIEVESAVGRGSTFTVRLPALDG